MNKTKLLVVTLSFVIILGTFTAIANANGFPNLPSSLVTVTVNTGPSSYPLSIILSDVPNGFDVHNQAYIGYCAALLTGIEPYVPYSAMLYSSLDLGVPWDKINWVINQPGQDPWDVQAAIWLLMGFTPSEILVYGGFSPSAPALSLAANAVAGFTPSAGQKVVVFCDVEGGQDLLIWLTIGKSQTAYGLYSEGTFKGFMTDLGFAKWGWTNYLPSEGDYVFDIWAGAAGEDTIKGTWIGTVTISYHSGAINWDVELVDGWMLSAEHVYAGNNDMPLYKNKETTSPGQYYIKTPLSGPIWVIWHGVVSQIQA